MREISHLYYEALAQHAVRVALTLLLPALLLEEVWNEWFATLSKAEVKLRCPMALRSSRLLSPCPAPYMKVASQIQVCLSTSQKTHFTIIQ